MFRGCSRTLKTPNSPPLNYNVYIKAFDYPNVNYYEVQGSELKKAVNYARISVWERGHSLHCGEVSLIE